MSTTSMLLRKLFLFLAGVGAAILVAIPGTAQADEGHRGHRGWHYGWVEGHGRRGWDDDHEFRVRRWTPWHHRFGFRFGRPVYRAYYHWTPYYYGYDWDCDED